MRFLADYYYLLATPHLDSFLSIRVVVYHFYNKSATFGGRVASVGM